MSVLFKTGEKYYRGVVKYKEYEKVNLITIERYDTKIIGFLLKKTMLQFLLVL